MFMHALLAVCSSYVVGPNVELALDHDAEAWEVQNHMRWRKDIPSPPLLGPTPTQYRMPDDAVILFERCKSLDDADAS